MGVGYKQQVNFQGRCRYITLVGECQFPQQCNNFMKTNQFTPFKGSIWIICAEFHGNINFRFGADMRTKRKVGLVDEGCNYPWGYKTRNILYNFIFPSNGG